MAEQKRFYWIKLKENFFDIETIDWLISQKNGCEYIVLYQKLCLLTANKGGNLQMQVGEMLIPYDVNKIARDTKFDIDTVIVAMELFKKIGLIYEQENGVLHIPYVNELVGSESSATERKRKSRQKQKALLGCDNVTKKTGQCHTEKEKREKRLEIRDLEAEEEKENEAYEPPRTRFTPPTLEDVEGYCIERNNNVDAQRFIDYYTSNGWKVGKNPMKDWKATVRNWERTGTDKPTPKADKPETSNPFLKILMEEGETL